MSSAAVPSQQPTLRDGDLVLRPRRADDRPGAPPEPDDGRVLGFAVERAGAVAGSVELRRSAAGCGRLSWAVSTDHLGQGTGVRAVRLLVSYAFTDLGLRRIEALVDPANLAALRLAARAGLRREGVVRGRAVRDGAPRDDVLLARLADDPEPNTPHGFRAVLNAGLPTKRVIAQGLLRDRAGRVLVCELTYKPDWDLPGGVVEPHESPRDCVAREIFEELGIDVTARELLTVDWLPPWQGWDDACLLVFDVGTVDASITATMRLEPREIVAVHWADPQTVQSRCRPQVADRLALLDGPGPVPAFLHGGRPPD